MNIFALDRDPEVSARYYGNIHLNKIFLEITQMLANCFSDEHLQSAPYTEAGTVRKKSHINHPVSIWMRKSKSNLQWAIEHALSLEQERLYRGFNPHKSMKFLKWCIDNINKSFVPEGSQTDFAVAISNDMICRSHPDFNKSDSVGKYRLYYSIDKRNMLKYTRREMPSWL
jgi:hypothetical protein